VWKVADLGSRNGIRVNGQRVAEARLCEGDILSLGGVRLMLTAAPTTEPPDVGRTAREPPDAGPPTEVPPGGSPGRLLARRYRLQELFHQGATGSFYRGFDTQAKRTVCVKVLAAHVAADEAQLRRFVRGVRAAARLRHRNIVSLYQAGRSRTDWWLAMEHVDGPSARRLAADVGVGNMLSPRRVFEIACDVAAALDAAFTRQVLHRNLRPDSILLTRQGTAKLGNFTLARGVVRDTLDQVTSTTGLVGDLAYMAPELTQPDGFADCRADLYGLGACLYALLTGRPPFTGTGTVDLLERVRREAPVPPSRINLAVPAPLEAIVLKCLAKSPTDRYASPAELGAELARAGRYQGLWR
jgi:serine/threonine-protein kinase